MNRIYLCEQLTSVYKVTVVPDVMPYYVIGFRGTSCLSIRVEQLSVQVH